MKTKTIKAWAITYPKDDMPEICYSKKYAKIKQENYDFKTEIIPCQITLLKK